MIALALDTSSAAVTAAVAEVGDRVEVLAVRCTVNARAHGELLAPSIAAVLAEAGRDATDVDAVVAGVGPGPFTGLRVGLVTAAAFADARRLPTYAVCSLDAIAAAVDAESLLVATDARRREVYWARYVRGQRVAGPDVSRPADVPVDGVTAMTGAGARLYADVLGRPLRDIDYPPPAALLGLAADRIRHRAPSETLIPLYLRRPDAVPTVGRTA